jgi:hypothetical protein
MPEEAEYEKLRVHISGMQQEGDVLRVPELSFVEQAIARLLFSARR